MEVLENWLNAGSVICRVCGKQIQTRVHVLSRDAAGSPTTDSTRNGECGGCGHRYIEPLEKAVIS